MTHHKNAAHVKFDGSVVISCGHMPEHDGQFVVFHLTDRKRPAGSKVKAADEIGCQEEIAFQFMSVESIDALMFQLKEARKDFVKRQRKKAMRDIEKAQRAKESDQ